jgi:hypothetical protein
MNIEDGKQILLNIQNFSLPEAFNNSQGKTLMSNICAFLLTLTACTLPFVRPEQTTSALGFATLATGLLATHRLSKDKSINAKTNESNNQTQ